MIIEIDIIGKDKDSILVEDTSPVKEKPSEPKKLEGLLDLGLQIIEIEGT